MHVDAKRARCWKYSPGDPKSLIPPGSTFQPNREAVSTGLFFVDIICTQPEPTLPILIETNKNRQIRLPRGRNGFSFLEVVNKKEPKYQIRNPYELTNAIITSDNKCNDCFLLHSKIPAQSPDDCLQIILGTKDSTLQQPHSIGLCISADAKMSKGFADLLSTDSWTSRCMQTDKIIDRANLSIMGPRWEPIYLQFGDENLLF